MPSVSGPASAPGGVGHVSPVSEGVRQTPSKRAQRSTAGALPCARLAAGTAHSRETSAATKMTFTCRSLTLLQNKLRSLCLPLCWQRKVGLLAHG